MMGQGESKQEQPVEKSPEERANRVMNSSMEVEEEEDGDGYDNLLGDDADEQRLLRQRRQQGQQKWSGGASSDGAGNLPIVTPYVPRRMVNARLPRGNKAMSLAAIDDQKVFSPTTRLNAATAIGDETNTQGPSSHGDLDAWIEQLYRCEPLAEGDVIALCHKAKEILLQEPSVKHIPCPVSVCGDIHGQFQDLGELFRIGGRVPDTRYLFLGDFVDRGNNSVETFQLMIALKVRYPDRIFLLRGNHESRQITSVYGFYAECQRKYPGVLVWRHCCEVFDCLGLAAVIGNKMLCVHGGLSPAIETVDQIQALNRRREVPHEGPICDLLWSDPDENVRRFALSARGAGYLFGWQAVEEFTRNNNIDQVARAHQLVMEGFKFNFDKRVITVWSAPNYCYRCGNVASIMKLDDEMRPTFEVFKSPIPTQPKVAPPKSITSYFL